MFKIEELLKIFLGIIILAFAINLNNIAKTGISQIQIITAFIFVALIVLVNVFAKKLAAYYYHSHAEIKIWNIERYGLRQGQHFNKPVPAGIIFPFFISLLSYGYFMWMAIFEFDVNPSSSRASKKHDIYKFSEMTDFDIGMIASAGVVANLFAAIIGYIAGFPEFAKLSIYFAAFSLVPISSLDGTKIFFGSRNLVLWITLVVITTIALGYAWLLV